MVTSTEQNEQDDYVSVFYKTIKLQPLLLRVYKHLSIKKLGSVQQRRQAKTPVNLHCKKVLLTMPRLWYTQNILFVSDETSVYSFIIYLDSK